MQSSLKRELTTFSATALVVANMIGTGIFTTTGFLAADLGRSSLVLGVWIVGGIVALAGCLVYGELSVNLPRSGGEYVYLREAWGPVWGFVSGWVSFFAGFSAPIAAGGLAFAAYLSYFFPSLSPSSSDSFLHSGIGWIHLGNGQLLAVGIIVVFAVVNILGLRFAASLQNTLTLLKIGVLSAFLALAFIIGHGNWHHFVLSSPRASSHNLALQFAVSLTFVMFAYSGWNAATYVAEEIRTPERSLPLALVGGTLLVIVFYLACNVAFIYALPLEKLKGVLPVGSEAAKALLTGRGGAIFSGMMAAALLSCISAMVIVGPRVYYAMARDGCFFPSAGRVHTKFQTPAVAILFQGLATVVMIITGSFEALIYYIGFMLVLFAALATAGIFRLRKRPNWQKLPAVDRLFPLVPGVFLVASCGMLISTVRLRPMESFFGLLTVCFGAGLYWWTSLRNQNRRRV
ncbi:MAG: amino acid permease [Acidobacteria bacterium]|nr:MAG: amino acid permease [Acidobacteriota bacterium]